MAAKPPKPPGNLNRITPSTNRNSCDFENFNIDRQSITEVNNNQSMILKNNNQINNNYSENNIINNKDINNSIQSLILNNGEQIISDNKLQYNKEISNNFKSPCNCTNVTIMHLFHEMKQKFPTLPDTIVSQCVNENCHRRSDCIEMLRHELELNPIPAQSYPAKVLQTLISSSNASAIQSSGMNLWPTMQKSSSSSSSSSAINSPTVGVTLISTTTNNVLSTSSNLHLSSPIQQSLPPINMITKPLKPIRPAPLQPPISSISTQNNILDINCFEIKNLMYTSPNPIDKTNSSSLMQQYQKDNLIDWVEKESFKVEEQEHEKIIHQNSEAINDNNCKNQWNMGATTKLRPTTLDLDDSCISLPLNSINEAELQIEQQQLQLLKIQREQYFQLQQQYNKDRQDFDLQKNNNYLGLDEEKLIYLRPAPKIEERTMPLNKPLRRAPLPPIIDKKSQKSAINQLLTCTALGNCTTTPTTTSPVLKNTSPNSKLKSPIRHRAVITLEPEPPYSKDFLIDLTESHLGTLEKQPTVLFKTSEAKSLKNGRPEINDAGQKSYTSVNLTLRQPSLTIEENSSSNGGHGTMDTTWLLTSPSSSGTIDISAGPNLSNHTGRTRTTGLTYTSTSYDARSRCQKNFHITVNDNGGGIFRASRIGPSLLQDNFNVERLQGINKGVNIYDKNNSINNYRDNNYNNIDENGGNSILLQQNLNRELNLLQDQRYLQQNYNKDRVLSINQQKNLDLEINQIKDIENVIQQNKSSFQSNSILKNSNHNVNDIKRYDNLLPDNKQFLIPTMSGYAATVLLRQKKCRDRLGAALRENKKRLQGLELEINLLMRPISSDLGQRLDNEILQLRDKCQILINEIEIVRRVANNGDKHQKSNVNITKTFPTYQSLNNLHGVVQGQNSSLSSKSSSSMSTTPQTMTNHIVNVNSSIGNSIEYQQYPYEPKLRPESTIKTYDTTTNSILHNISNSCNQLEQHQQEAVGDNSNNTGTGLNTNTNAIANDNEETTLAPWECNMCTFLNHPELNICECCDNVRIIPGMLRKRALVNLIKDKNVITTTIKEVYQQDYHNHSSQNSNHKS